MMRAAVLAVVVLFAPHLALAQICPELLAAARRLALVTADTFASTVATL
jgi:hypothetical protein